MYHVTSNLTPTLLTLQNILHFDHVSFDNHCFGSEELFQDLISYREGISNHIEGTTDSFHPVTAMKDQATFLSLVAHADK